MCISLRVKYVFNQYLQKNKNQTLVNDPILHGTWDFSEMEVQLYERIQRTVCILTHISHSLLAQKNISRKKKE